MQEKLSREHYLESPGVTIESIIDTRVLEFENVTKRNFDVMANPKKDPPAVRIRGLKPTQKGFVQHYLRPTLSVVPDKAFPNGADEEVVER